ncbi:MAG: DUF3784 domain-containing protein [Oscillospiraceae bacterium]|nr:DUF3784 domain-containing protein [Oscillospiraceae bacterium]
MWLYSIIMFLVGLAFVWCGIAIYRGGTDLIHSYHQTRVKDKSAYGKAFGKSMLVIAVGMLASGIINVCGSSEVFMIVAVVVLVVGIVTGLACIVAVQMKYNKGIF